MKTWATLGQESCKATLTDVLPLSCFLLLYFIYVLLILLHTFQRRLRRS